ncbi:MAG TPA: hypothetical protein VI319_13465, partial [Burkholderiales bacterium]
MTVKRMDNVGILVDSLDAAISFFAELAPGPLDDVRSIDGDAPAKQVDGSLDAQEQRPALSLELDRIGIDWPPMIGPRAQRQRRQLGGEGRTALAEPLEVQARASGTDEVGPFVDTA